MKVHIGLGIGCGVYVNLSIVDEEGSSKPKSHIGKAHLFHTTHDRLIQGLYSRSQIISKQPHRRY